jgi:hypothetical protein
MAFADDLVGAQTIEVTDKERDKTIFWNIK